MAAFVRPLPHLPSHPSLSVLWFELRLLLYLLERFGRIWTLPMWKQCSVQACGQHCSVQYCCICVSDSPQCHPSHLPCPSVSRPVLPPTFTLSPPSLDAQKRPEENQTRHLQVKPVHMVPVSAGIWLKIQARTSAPLFVRFFSTAMSDFCQMPSDTDICLTPSA